MPNAKDARHSVTRRILLLGDTGTGKTAQLLTLPGKKFVYAFDSNTLPTIEGFDIDYEEYLPSPVSAAASSLSKGKTPDRRIHTSSDVYRDWELTFEERLQNGFHDAHDWVCFDSGTTLQDLMMDRIMTINGRYGQWPHEDDWGPQMNSFMNFCRTLSGSGLNVVVTGHMQDKRKGRGADAGTRRVPMMTGSLIQKVPLLFSDILGCDSDKDEKGRVVYQLVTVRNAEFTVIRTAMRGLQPVENITIDFTQDPVGQGLGGVLAWEQEQRK
ncbi:MAG TPA: AAA family ATPase [Nitrospiraceae bacterium]